MMNTKNLLLSLIVDKVYCSYITIFWSLASNFSRTCKESKIAAGHTIDSDTCKLFCSIFLFSVFVALINVNCLTEMKRDIKNARENKDLSSSDLSDINVNVNRKINWNCQDNKKCNLEKNWRINPPLVLAKYNQFISKSFISIISQFVQQHEISQERYTKVALDIWYQKGR